MIWVVPYKDLCTAGAVHTTFRCCHIVSETARRRMGERSATHRFFRAGDISMGNAALTHPTIRPLSEKPMTSINDWLGRIAAGSQGFRRKYLVQVRGPHFGVGVAPMDRNWWLH